MLPKIIDPRRSADQDIEYHEPMQASLLQRLVDAVEEIGDEIWVRLRLFRDEQNRMRVQGEASADLTLQCQRCMQESPQKLVAEIDLVAVYSEQQAKALPKELDAWVVEESANLHELIEDELLLALPIVAMHSEGECSVPDQYQSRSELEDEKEERQSPFAVLKDLAGNSD